MYIYFKKKHEMFAGGVGSVGGAKSSLKGLGGLAGCQRGQKLLS